MFRVRLLLFLAALAVVGVRRAAAEIETSPEFPLAASKAVSESATVRLLAMYRKDVGIEAPSEKTSSEKPAVRPVVVLTESR